LFVLTAGSSHASGSAPSLAARTASPPVVPAGQLDRNLQDTAARLLSDARPVLGGIVAIDVKTGLVIAWRDYHRPGTARRFPLTRAVAPAASLFKLVTATALLERTPVMPSTQVCIRGGAHAISRKHLEPPTAGEPSRCRPFAEALGFSRNAAFAQLATSHLMRRDLVETGKQLGFNAPLPFDQPADMGTLAVPYNDLAFARTATGFTGSSLSVLGATWLAQIVASDGKPQPIRLRPGLSPDPPPLARRVMHRSTARRLRRMMEVTVHSGTSLNAFTNAHGGSYLGNVRVAGKTGTLRPDPNGPTTSWFIGFAPSRSPKIAIGVMLQNGRVWRRKANHVGRDVLRAFFQDRQGVSHPFDSSVSRLSTATPKASQ
jgi:cell division protein FtsI/penicillin-binding protein 2